MSGVTVLDFETDFSKRDGVDIGSLGTHHYVRNPAVEIYALSVASDSGTWVGHPKDFNWSSLAGQHIVSHNRAFDAGVEKRLVELEIKPKSLVYSGEGCSADLCAYLGGPRALKDAARVFLGKKLDKTLRDDASGKPWRQRPMSERKAMEQYALVDAITSLELWNKLSPQWPAHEQKLSQITRDSADWGVKVDKKRVRDGIAKLEEVLSVVVNEIPWGKTDKPLSKQALAAYCTKEGIPVPESIDEDSAEFSLWADAWGEKYPVVSAMRRHRNANIALQKLIILRDRTRDDDTVMIELKAYAAESTLRWGGAGKFNVHNLPKGEIEGVDVRACLIARSHKQLFDCDFSAIEPRTLAFLTGNTEFLDNVRSGMDVYEAAATVMGMYNGEKGKLKEDKILRPLVKIMVLGFGYSLSNPEKVVRYAKLNANLDLSLEQAAQLVKDFKRTNPRLVNMWLHMDCLYKGSVGGDFEMRLPSGRIIRWFNTSGMDYTYEKIKGMSSSRRRGYGGLALQNASQGMARDCLAEAILRIEKAGHKILFHVHDSIVTEVSGKEEAAEVERLMVIPPEWAPTLPLNAEGKLSKAYSK